MFFPIKLTQKKRQYPIDESPHLSNLHSIDWSITLIWSSSPKTENWAVELWCLWVLMNCSPGVYHPSTYCVRMFTYVSWMKIMWNTLQYVITSSHLTLYIVPTLNPLPSLPGCLVHQGAMQKHYSSFDMYFTSNDCFYKPFYSRVWHWREWLKEKTKNRTAKEQIGLVCEEKQRGGSGKVDKCQHTNQMPNLHMTLAQLYFQIWTVRTCLTIISPCDLPCLNFALLFNFKTK